LVPERVMMFVVEPVLWPNSALAVCVKMRNSVIASTGGSNTKTAVHSVEVVGAIDQEIIRLWPLAIHRIGLAVAQRSARRR